VLWQQVFQAVVCVLCAVLCVIAVAGSLLARKQSDENIGNICTDVICTLQTAVFVVKRIIMKIRLLIFCNVLQINNCQLD
jgi:hypothetical protein